MRDEEKVCQRCGRVYRFISNKKVGHTLCFCNSCAVNIRRKGFKHKCLEYKGSKCQICGYDKCEAVLDFHHIDPITKSFTLAESHCRAWKTIKEELDKCVVLCSNCHRELHAGIIDL